METTVSINGVIRESTYRKRTEAKRATTRRTIARFTQRETSPLERASRLVAQRASSRSTASGRNLSKNRSTANVVAALPRALSKLRGKEKTLLACSFFFSIYVRDVWARACVHTSMRACVRGRRDAREYIRDVMWCATRRRCAGIVNVMLMVLMGSRCHTSGMRIQSHAGVTLLPVYMPRVRTLRPDHLQSDLREPNEQTSRRSTLQRTTLISLFFLLLLFLLLRLTLSLSLSLSLALSLAIVSLFRYKNHAIYEREPCIRTIRVL